MVPIYNKVNIPRKENDMNNEKNYKIEDYTREEVSVRDYFLRVAHPAPNVQDELKTFMQQQTESLPVDEDSQDEAKTPGLYMEEEENHRIPLRGIGIALAIAASLALVFSRRSTTRGILSSSRRMASPRRYWARSSMSALIPRMIPTSLCCRVACSLAFSPPMPLQPSRLCPSV